MSAAEQAIEDAKQAIVDSEQSISELCTLETYLLTKVEGGGAPSRASSKKASGNKTGSRSSKKSDPETDSADSGSKGMQTVEFGPDGFPST